MLGWQKAQFFPADSERNFETRVLNDKGRYHSLGVRIRAAHPCGPEVGFWEVCTPRGCWDFFRLAILADAIAGCRVYYFLADGLSTARLRTRDSAPTACRSRPSGLGPGGRVSRVLA